MTDKTKLTSSSKSSETPSNVELSKRSIVDAKKSEKNNMVKKTRKEKREERPFAKILMRLMSEKNISVPKAASVAGVSSSTISDWRGGTTPEDYLAVQKLANYMGVSLSFILTGKEDNSTRSVPAIEEVFELGDELFDGFAQISIKRLIPRNKEKKRD